MAEIVITIAVSIAAKAAEYLVEPTIQRGQYLFSANMIIQNFGKEMKRLSANIKKMQKQIQDKKKATKLIVAEEKWVTEAENILNEAKKIFKAAEGLKQEMEANKNCENPKQEMEANKNCFQGWCPPWRRYCMLKQMGKKTKQMREQISREIETCSELMPLSDISYDCSEGFTYFRSTNVAYEEILEALQDDETKIIGLYGMGGCGKTALVNEVKRTAKKFEPAKKFQPFDVIILVTMSQTPNINAIQGEMAKMLDLELEEKTVEERAARLSQSLQAHKRVLIIVDDVWGQFNLRDIGIACDETHKGSCKVLLTTRNLEVCALMECQRQIMLHLLSDEEAWRLFQKCARIADNSPEMILKLAREVSERCKGLPIAIKVMGSSLKGKRREFQVDQLKVALKTVKKGGGEGDVFKCLRISYDYLTTKEAKHLLLMCAMFPEDHEIYIEDLIRYGVGLGICGEFESFDLARSQIRMGLSELLDSCLLMYSERKTHVKMHDLIRGIALSISSEMGQKIMVNHEEDLDSLAENKVLKEYFAISSWCNGIDQLFRQLDAPKLEILMVNTRGSLDLSHVSFEFTKRLKVMAIIHEILPRAPSRPQSIQSLTNLKTLCLRNWKLGDISFILSLERIEVLDLQSCAFDEVSDKIEKLHNLKLLDLTNTNIKNYNSKAIGRCSQLKELYVSACFGSRTFPPRCFVHDVNPTSLLRYKLELGQSISKHLPDDDSIRRSLELENFDVSTIDRSKENLLQKAEFVIFDVLHGGFKNIFPGIDQAVGCMNELNRLHLYSCLEIECLFDTTSNHAGSFQGDALLPCRLITLRLEGMKNLTEVCHGEPPRDLFKKLEELHISRCEQLHSIFPQQCNLVNLKILNIYRGGSSSGTSCCVVVLFSMSIAKNMQQLEELTIEGCPELRNVTTTEVEDGAKAGEEISLASNNSHFLFPNLKKLRICECPRLEVIFAISCVQQNETQTMLSSVQVFELHDLENLLGIFPQNYNSRLPSVSEISWKNCPKLTTMWTGLELRKQHLNEEVLSFQYLQCLEIVGIKEMKFIFSTAVLRSLSELTSLKIGTCEELVEIIAENEESKNFAPAEVFFPKLSKLEVEQCNKLKSLFSIATIRALPQLKSLEIGTCEELVEIIAENEESKNFAPAEVFFPELFELEVEQCNKLKSLFSIAMIRVLPQLMYLKIGTCEELVEIIAENEESKNFAPAEVFFPKLYELEVEQCNKLKSLFSIATIRALPQLKLLEIGTCEELVEIIAENEESKNFAPAEVFLTELFELKVKQCNKLKSLFSIGTLRALRQLRSLKIHTCGELVEIIAENEESKNFAPVEVFFPELYELEVEQCNKLKSLFSIATIRALPQLMLKVEQCNKLKSLFSIATIRALPQLKSLKIGTCEELVEIIAENEESKNFAPTEVFFPVLYKLEVEQCNKLKRLFSIATIRALPQLKSLEIGTCEELVEIIAENEESKIFAPAEVFFPKLYKLKVEQCNKLKSLFSIATIRALPQLESLKIGTCEELVEIIAENEESKNFAPAEVFFPVLCKLEVGQCNKLKRLFSIATIRALPQLKSLEIGTCEELVEIIAENEESKNFAPAEVFFPKLSELKVKQCNKLKCIFYADCLAFRRCASLRWLCASHCSQLERICGLKHPTEADNKDLGEREVLLDLNSLELESLPNFTELGQGIKLKKQTSDFYMVTDCPKYNQQFPVPNTDDDNDSDDDDVAGSSQL